MKMLTTLLLLAPLTAQATTPVADRNFRRAFGNQVTEITQIMVEGRFWDADGVGASGEAGPRSFWS